MKALVLTRYGGPDASQLQDIARPSPAAGEVLVRVMAAGLNPVDFKTREGKLKIILPYTLPTVMGNELAGVVEEVGQGVSGFAVGDRVFARTPKLAMGAFAEFAAIPADLLAPMPPSLGFPEGGGIPLAGLTALQALRDEMQLGPGSRVFIPGGAGGVGTLAIQIAKWLGAEVITTASPRGRALVERLGADQVIDLAEDRERFAALVERLGADRVIDYTTEDFVNHVRDVDGVFDLIGGETLNKSFGVVKPGGMVLSITALPEPQTALKDLGRGMGLAALFWFASWSLRAKARKHGVRYRFLFMHPSGSELAELAQLIEDGRLEPILDRSFPLDQIEEAMAYLEAGRAKGKVVVTMGEV